MDFTIKIYITLLESLQSHGFFFQTFENFIKSPKNKVIILRHDVDKLPQNSLKFAQIQHKMSIRGTYYFRAVPGSWDAQIIKKIANLGHKIGYHYENLAVFKGNMEKSLENFKTNLEKFRELAPVTTICMHGSPRYKYDNKLLWEKYNYRDYGIIGEPHFDIDFNKVLYLTDTGRRWDGWKVSVRDKIPQQEKWINQGLVFRSTRNIIEAANELKLPNQIMFTFHPQRWTDNFIFWTKELILQSSKNIVKKFFFVR
ncbi:MAG: hypothetical protein HY738_22210 [Bacteroidia bacterium]|nr:hypothetical protein [Bacteroidia bacterium]